MPPKKAAVPAGPPLPTIEELITLPPELSAKFVEPPFQCCLVHHPESSLTLELAPEEEEERGKLEEIRPNELLVEHYKRVVVEDPLSKSVLLVEREELKTIADSIPSPSLAKGLALKLERECGARKSRRSNLARKALQDGTEEPRFEESLDLVLHLIDYPSTPEELSELLEEGVVEKVDVWLGAFVSGATTIEEESPQPSDPDAPPVPPTRRQECLQPSAQLLEWHRLSQEAPLTSKLSNARVVKLPEVQTLLSAAFHEASQGEQPKLEVAGNKFCSELASLVSEECQHSRDFKTWLDQIPEAGQASFERTGAKSETVNLQLYRQLADSISISNQDIPTLLHCLCEQVAANVDGNRHDSYGGPAARLHYLAPRGDVEEDPEESRELSLLEEFLDGAHSRLLLGDLPDMGFHEEVEESKPPEIGEETSGGASGVRHTGTLPGLHDGSLVLPYLDKVSCLHAGDELPGAVSVVAEVQRLLSHITLPGVRRNGFPDAPYTSAERSAIRNRLYPYLPSFSIVEIERMMLVKGFQDLLKSVQPERLEHDLNDRIFHEKIPKELLVQLLLEGAKEELFLDTQYDERHDCLLIALHPRAMPGCSVWHSWAGDLLAEGSALAPRPSYNDWFQLLSGQAPGLAARAPTEPGAKPKNRCDLDARTFGYGRIIEQSICGPDGSIVLATTTQRGLKESTCSPSAEEDLANFPATPSLERRLLRVLREGVVFGIATDEAWGPVTEALAEARQKREAARAEAQAALDAALEERRVAAAEREAQGLPPEEEDENAEPREPLPEVPALDPEPSAPSERLIENLEFGQFWSSFPDGARCSVGLRHDVPWFEEGATIVDIGATRPSLTFVYTTAAGSSLQVLPDGSLVEYSPRQACAERVRRQMGTDNSGARPGGPADVEVSRTITSAGILTKELLSGRLEVYHPDGTRSFRNPTWEELQLRLAKHRSVAEEGCALLAYLESLAIHYETVVKWRALKSRPPPLARAAGLPGHWVVIQSGGVCFGRVDRPPKQEAEELDPEAEGEVPTQPQADEEELLTNLLDGWVIEEENVIQYEINTVSVTCVTDPHTEQHVSTSGDAVMIIEDGDRSCSTAILTDGTRITSRTDPCLQVLIEHSTSSTVACEFKDSSAATTVRCKDGTVLQVIPQSYSNAAFVPTVAPTCSSHASPECRNAAVVLRRPDGSILASRGSGSLVLLKPSEAEGLSEKLFLDLSPLDSLGNVGYRVDLEQNRLSFSDDTSGFQLEVYGHSQISVGVPGLPLTSEAPSCVQPMKEYCLPAARALPPPEACLPARLFVVYSNGEAEELLQEKTVRDLLKSAETDPATSVTMDQAMGPPMDCCKCHSIYRTISLTSQSGESGSEAASLIPPTLSGSLGCTSNGERKEYTRFRQFIEYPQPSTKECRLFATAYEKFQIEEAAHRDKYQAYGQGLLRSKAPIQPASRKTSEADRNVAPAEGGA